MGFFARIRARRKQKKKIEAEEARIGIDSVPERKKEPAGTQGIQHFVIECCEQIIEARKEIEEETAEYRIVTSYLNDIQILEDLPEEDRKEITSAAENVQKLDRLRDDFQNSEKKISDVQFVQMQQEENEIPDAIVRLQTNEAYQNTVKKDMNYLEGEKTEWHYRKLELKHQQKMLQGLAMALLLLVLAGGVVLFVLHTGFRVDTTYAWMILVLLAGAGSFGIYLKISSNQAQIRQAETNINHAITLLNKVKFKYVNVTNAVDYAREKYHVRNSYELNYLWEQYLNEVREREKFRQANEDLEYFNSKLVRQLKRYRLYDAAVWVNQSSALLDKKEMVEVKHNLIVRRQKLRARIEYNNQNIRERREQINELLTKNHINTPQICEILDSIDNLDTPE